MQAVSKIIRLREQALEPATTEEALKERAEDREAQERQAKAIIEEHCKHHECKDIPIHK